MSDPGGQDGKKSTDDAWADLLGDTGSSPAAPPVVPSVVAPPAVGAPAAPLPALPDIPGLGDLPPLTAPGAPLVPSAPLVAPGAPAVAPSPPVVSPNPNLAATEESGPAEPSDPATTPAASEAFGSGARVSSAADAAAPNDEPEPSSEAEAPESATDAADEEEDEAPEAATDTVDEDEAEAAQPSPQAPQDLSEADVSNDEPAAEKDEPTKQEEPLAKSEKEPLPAPAAAAEPQGGAGLGTGAWVLIGVAAAALAYLVVGGPSKEAPKPESAVVSSAPTQAEATSRKAAAPEAPPQVGDESDGAGAEDFVADGESAAPSLADASSSETVVAEEVATGEETADGAADETTAAEDLEAAEDPEAAEAEAAAAEAQAAAEAAAVAEAARPEAAVPAAGDSPAERIVDNPRDPSLVPAGTDPANEKAFLSMPVGVADGGPIGGIGKGGIHLDRISLGTETGKKDCSGKSDDFSVGAGESVHVCFRVIQRRVETELKVMWKRDGTTVRRSPLTIKPTHAYRTRARLALRPEYVGQWTVSVVSEDGVELAQRSFTVTP